MAGDGRTISMQYYLSLECIWRVDFFVQNDYSQNLDADCILHTSDFEMKTFILVIRRVFFKTNLNGLRGIIFF